MKNILKYIKIFAILIISFFAFSVLSCLIPHESVKKNIEKSLPELLEEGDYPKAMFNGSRYQQDNFTDALILNIAVSNDYSKPIWSALVNPLSFQNPESNTMVNYLDYRINHIDLTTNTLYGRYWHGSSSFYRILLLIMDYQLLTWILYIVSTLLLLIFAVKVVNKAGWIKSLPIFLALLFANFFVTQFSLQFFPVMAISLIGGIWMCENSTKSQNKVFIYLFITGMVTAYFDLLTAPLLTLGLPLIVYMILQGEEKKSVYEFYKSIFLLCIFWFIGYAAAWASKWILVCIFFADVDALNLVNAINYRISTYGYTRWDAIARNFSLIPLVWLNLVLSFLLLLTFLSFNKKGIMQAIAFLLVGLLPYIWYFILSSHSHPHWWFTYRAQVISMSCVMLFFVSLIDWERMKSKLKIGVHRLKK